MSEESNVESVERPLSPRVHITYDVEIGDAIHSVELPFVLGVLADLCGQWEDELPPMQYRKFVEVDRGNFDEVLTAFAPHLALEVEGMHRTVGLCFRSLDDFTPDGVAAQVPGLLEGLRAGAPAASVQLDKILHAPVFQRLEATWRGLWYLIAETETGELLKIKVLNATREELLQDFRNVPRLEETALFGKICLEPFGIFREEPFAALIGDYEFSCRPDDIELLENISHVAALAHAPFIAAAGPAMFDLEDFTELSRCRTMCFWYDHADRGRWRAFRDTEDSRYVALVLPHILLRLPFGADTFPARGFAYEENVEAGHAQYLWGNAAYPLGARIAEAFRVYGWCAAIEGVEGGGLVGCLPCCCYRTDEGDVVKCPAETWINEMREEELSRLGFICLVGCRNTGFAAFFSTPTCQRPGRYNSDQATHAAYLGTRLPFVLAVSRFVHYLKAIMRDPIDAFASREDVERFLNLWIHQYVMPDDSASAEVKARFPLREARIEVAEIREQSGRYRAAAFLRPHFQLLNTPLAIRVIADLPPPARSA